MKKVAIRESGVLAYDEFDCTPPWLAAETVILVPGFTKTRRFWYEWVPELAKHYRVIAVDQRGHGDSSALPTDFKMSVPEFADDLADFSKQLGISKAHYVMAEFTSAIALVFAATHPQLVQSLVLPGFIYKPGNSVDWEGWAQIVDRQGSEAWARATNDHRLPPDANPSMREWYVTQQGRFDPCALAHFFRFVPTMDLTEYLARVMAPTLVIHGELARVQPLADVVSVTRSMPTVTLKVMPTTTFNVMSAASEATLKETLGFLAQHPVSSHQ